MGLEKYMTEKPKHHPVNICLTEEEIKILGMLAVKHGVTKTSIVRALMKKEIAENDSKTTL